MIRFAAVTSIPPGQPEAPSAPTTILCVASYFKGNDFIDQCKQEGCRVLLLTLASLLGKPWIRSCQTYHYMLESEYQKLKEDQDG